MNPKDIPAFPTEVGPGADGGFQSGNERWHAPGMTQRHYLAAAAMQGICAHTDTWGLLAPEIAAKAYELADEMLKAGQS